MEFWLSFNNGQEKLQFPVPPPSFKIRTGNLNTVVKINDVGEVNLIGKRKLDSITISSFFPAQVYPFCQYSNFPEPYECVKTIKSWKESGKPIRLIITDTDINLPVAIEEFIYGERDGTGDVYFTLVLKEYRFLNVSTQTIVTNTTNNIIRPVEKQIPNIYIVKSGDTLWMISKRVYGDGSKWREIASKNGIKDPKMLQVGQRLII